MLVSFQRRFVGAVQNGLDHLQDRPLRWEGVAPKFQTIRRPRADRRLPSPGELLHLWCTARSPAGFKLGIVRCVACDRVDLFLGRDFEIRVAGRNVTGDEFARSDGFGDLEEMRVFWRQHHVFEDGAWTGFLYRWDRVHWEPLT